MVVLLLASERSERDTLRSVQLKIGNIILYRYICDENKLNCTLNDRLTFSNIRGRSSHRIYIILLKEIDLAVFVL